MKKIQLFKDIRINSGKYRRKTLYRADASITRPALNRSRTGVFNVINSKFENKFNVILDCFAGSGAIAIEALSREIAKKAIMCDISKEAVHALEKNIQLLDDKDRNNCLIVHGNILPLIANFTESDLIFIDPPYKDTKSISNILLKNISLLNFKKESVIVIETDAVNKVDFIIPSNIELIDKRKYGRNEFLFFIKKYVIE